MLKSVKTKFFATLCATVMTLGVVAPSFNNPVSAASPKTVYVDVEKNITGQPLILQPKAIQASDTETIADVTKRAAGASNVDVQTSKYGPYIAAFRDKTNDFEYPFTAKLQELTKGKDNKSVVYRTDLPEQPIISDANWLREKEYNGISGWMFTVNNTDNENYNFYNASTKVSDLKDGAVIRWEYSMACGCDLGRPGYLPDGTVSKDGLYNWNYDQVSPFFTRADKTELIKAMANYNNKADEAYTNALETLGNLQSDKTTVDEATEALK